MSKNLHLVPAVGSLDELAAYVNSRDKFIRQANQARAMAAKSLLQEDREHWLALAENWEELARTSANEKQDEEKT